MADKRINSTMSGEKAIFMEIQTKPVSVMITPSIVSYIKK